MLTVLNSCRRIVSPQSVFRVLQKEKVKSFKDNKDMRHRHLSTTSYFCNKNEGELEDGEPMAKGDKLLRMRLATTRLDAILKAGLGISRSKIEKAFYEDRIRLNGERAKKKSQVLDEGDEIDIVRGTNKLNPLFLEVSRVEIIEVDGPSASKNEDPSDSGDEEQSKKIPLVLKRYKSLTIENYEVPWKGPPAE